METDRVAIHVRMYIIVLDWGYGNIEYIIITIKFIFLYTLKNNKINNWIK